MVDTLVYFLAQLLRKIWDRINLFVTELMYACSKLQLRNMLVITEYLNRNRYTRVRYNTESHFLFIEWARALTPSFSDMLICCFYLSCQVPLMSWTIGESYFSINQLKFKSTLFNHTTLLTALVWKNYFNTLKLNNKVHNLCRLQF